MSLTCALYPLTSFRAVLVIVVEISLDTAISFEDFERELVLSLLFPFF